MCFEAKLCLARDYSRRVFFSFELPEAAYFRGREDFNWAKLKAWIILGDLILARQSLVGGRMMKVVEKSDSSTLNGFIVNVLKSSCGFGNQRSRVEQEE